MPEQFSNAMKHGSPANVTQLLQAWCSGDEKALEQLTPIVYAELRRLARGQIAGERRSHTLESGALVNEAFLRLCNWKNVEWKNRAHFLGVSSQIMRKILVDHARQRTAQKRGGGARATTLKDVAAVMPEISPDLIDLNRALEALAILDGRKARVVEMLFFGQATMEEVSEALNVSQMTVVRDWKFARAWLHKELTGGGE